jgi:hypothetical protein
MADLKKHKRQLFKHKVKLTELESEKTHKKSDLHLIR